MLRLGKYPRLTAFPAPKLGHWMLLKKLDVLTAPEVYNILLLWNHYLFYAVVQKNKTKRQPTIVVWEMFYPARNYCR